jgi:hypothetical protein
MKSKPPRSEAPKSSSALLRALIPAGLLCALGWYVTPAGSAWWPWLWIWPLVTLFARGALHAWRTQRTVLHGRFGGSLELRGTQARLCAVAFAMAGGAILGIAELSALQEAPDERLLRLMGLEAILFGGCLALLFGVLVHFLVRLQRPAARALIVMLSPLLIVTSGLALMGAYMLATGTPLR